LIDRGVVVLAVIHLVVRRGVELDEDEDEEEQESFDGIGDQPRRPPAAETSTATFAFAIWGLVIPGAALYATLHSPVLPITVTTLTAGGVLVMNIFFTQLLKRPAEGH
jgi:hypothetical protein